MTLTTTSSAFGHFQWKMKLLLFTSLSTTRLARVESLKLPKKVYLSFCVFFFFFFFLIVALFIYIYFSFLMHYEKHWLLSMTPLCALTYQALTGTSTTWATTHLLLLYLLEFQVLYLSSVLFSSVLPPLFFLLCSSSILSSAPLL
jgi:hypothetical protein